jgi:hypothetical protein
MNKNQDLLSQPWFKRTRSSLRGFFGAMNRRLAPACEKQCLILQTILAVVIVVIGIKLGKVVFTYVAINSARTSLALLYSPWLARVSAAGVAVIVVGMLAFPRRKWLVITSPFIVLVLAVLAKLAQAILTGERVVAYYRRADDWLVDAATQLRLLLPIVAIVLRRDIIFLGCFAILVYATVTLTPAKYLPALRILLTTFTGLLLLISGLELAHYCKTSITGTGQLLRFFVTNAAGLWPMIRTQIDFISLSALVAPPLVGLAVALFVHSWYARTERRTAPPLTRVFAVVFALPLAAAFIPPLPRDARYDRFVDNTYLGLRDLIPRRKAGELEAMKRASRLPILSDTSKAVLRAKVDAVTRPRNVIIIMLESARADSNSIYDPTLGNTPFLTTRLRGGHKQGSSGKRAYQPCLRHVDMRQHFLLQRT